MRRKTTTDDKDVEKLELSYDAGENLKHVRHFGKRSGGDRSG